MSDVHFDHDGSMWLAQYGEVCTLGFGDTQEEAEEVLWHFMARDYARALVDPGLDDEHLDAMRAALRDAGLLP